jgi:uncharacterized membrane protein (DUF373 family)
METTVQPPTRPAEDKLRIYSCGYFCLVEVAIYILLGILIAATGLLALSGAGVLLWNGWRELTLATSAFQIMDRLLFVLMLVEILHTVRISIRSHTLVTEPFLVVGLIASIRRMLVITLEASNLVQPERWATNGESIFRASMFELGLLAGLVLVLVVCIVILRRYPALAQNQENSEENNSLPGFVRKMQEKF